MSEPVPRIRTPLKRLLHSDHAFLEHLILLTALVAVALYACVLPLWEGWDEPFHYAYIETLAVSHQLPVLNQTTVSSEIADSLVDTPLTRFLASPVVGSTSFEQWHQLSSAQRFKLRKRLTEIPSSARRETGGNPNYEAQQTPLAYLLLAPVDAALGHFQLVRRILLLRLLGGLASMLVLYAGLKNLADGLDLRGFFRSACFLCALSGQVLWASIAHVDNDMLSIPLTVWFLALLLRRHSAVALASVLGAGLLTKAYFLSFVPIFAAAVIYRFKKREVTLVQTAISFLLPILIAGWWYARNIALYGSFSGTQESVSGVTFSKALTAIPHINWLRAFLILLRASLWTGNWSFTSFSKGTLNVDLLLVLLAVLLSAQNFRRERARELWLWAAAASFVGGLFYQTCVTWVHTAGAAVTPEPWYWQGVVVCLWALLFRGLQSARHFGRFCASALCLLATWIAALTYITKLLPYYGGGVNRGTVSALILWWKTNPTQDLTPTVLAPVPVVYVLLFCFLMLLVYGTAGVLRACWDGDSRVSEGSSDPPSTRAAVHSNS